MESVAIMKFRELEDKNSKQALLNKAAEDWDDARELFKLDKP